MSRFNPFLIFLVVASSAEFSCLLTLQAAPRRINSHSSKQTSRHKLQELSRNKDSLYAMFIERAYPEEANDLRHLLDAGVPVNIRFDDADHDTPLTHAAGFGHATAVRLLLKRGADPDTQTDDGKTALWNAANADLSESGSYTDLPQPPTPTQSRAWSDAYTDIIRALIKSGANPNIADKNGVTPLGVATYRGREAEVAALLQGGANPNRRDHFGKTPIEWAAYRSFPNIVKLLRTHGAWIAPAGLRGKAGRVLDAQLVDAIGRHDLKAVQNLLKRHADPNAHFNWIDTTENSALTGIITPLLVATASPLITRWLLQKGANPDASDETGRTALMSAPTEIMRLLLWRGARVNARDHEGTTALMNSANEPDQVALLLAHGANVRARNKEGASAMQNCHDESALKLLLAHGANINERDNEGRTALINTADSVGGEAGVPTCDEPWCRVLLRHGADPNIRDPRGNTALMLLASQGDYGSIYNSGDQIGLVRTLLKFGARRDIRNKRGHTALQLAHASQAYGVARVLQSWKPTVRKRRTFKSGISVNAHRDVRAR